MLKLETLEELEWIEEVSLSFTNETLIPNSKQICPRKYNMALHDQSNSLDVVYRKALMRRQTMTKHERTGDLSAPNCNKTNPHLLVRYQGFQRN